MSSEPPVASLRDIVQEAGQGHLLADWDNLSADQLSSLTSDIQVRLAQFPETAASHRWAL